MSYKLDPEKAFKLLNCINVPVILVNGPKSVGKTTFVNKFREEGYSILDVKNMEISKIRNAVERNKKFNLNLILETDETDEQKINKIFENIYFTYIFIYPNDIKKYKELLESSGIKKTNKELLELINEIKLIYKKHLEFFDEKILTILL